MTAHLAFGLAACLQIAGATGDQSGQDDLAKLQGTWLCVSMERNGKPIPPERYKDGRLVMEGEKFTYYEGQRIATQGVRRLDPTRTPKHVDDTHSIGFFKGKTYLGIYELAGDTFKTCNGSAGQARPTEFATKPGSGLLLIVYKREKPGPPAPR